MTTEAIEIIAAIGATIWVFGALAGWIAALSANDINFGILALFWPITLPIHGLRLLIGRFRTHRPKVKVNLGPIRVTHGPDTKLPWEVRSGNVIIDQFPMQSGALRLAAEMAEKYPSLEDS